MSARFHIDANAVVKQKVQGSEYIHGEKEMSCLYNQWGWCTQTDRKPEVNKDYCIKSWKPVEYCLQSGLMYRITLTSEY